MRTKEEDGVAALSTEELQQIAGGETAPRSGWFYFSYFIGEVVGYVTSPGETVPGGWSAWHG